MIIKPISQAFLLSLILLFGSLYWVTLGDPMQEVYLTLATLGLIGFSLVLEQLLPLHRAWNEPKGDVAGDIGSFVLVFGFIDGALKWLSPFLLLAVLPEFGLEVSWPLWVQIIVATLVIELGSWISHWAHHKFKPLWALHAMHHSTQRLYTLNNFRFHPFNHILNYLVAFVPLLVLGISSQALLGYTALTLPILILQHANVGFQFGHLNFIFNTNTLHRWHHSSAETEGMHNFGRALVLFDQIFGTYYYSSDKKEPVDIGLASGNSAYPGASRTLQQIMWPFSKQCCR